MVTSSMDEALIAASIPSRRDEFVAYIFETRLPEVHDSHGNVVDDSGLSQATSRTQSDTTPCVAEVDIGHSTTRNAHSWCELESFVNHSQCLEFFSRNGPNFKMKRWTDKERICRMLLDMAENMIVLTPPEKPVAWDILNMNLWKDSLWELIKEMKTVEENFPSFVENTPSGVCVLTASPYAAFLRLVAAEIADRC